LRAGLERIAWIMPAIPEAISAGERFCRRCAGAAKHPLIAGERFPGESPDGAGTGTPSRITFSATAHRASKPCRNVLPNHRAVFLEE
jgi:hypothetical protein